MNRELTGSLAWGGGIVVLALAASFARQQGYMDADTVTRVVMCATGLMVAWYGNRIPKVVVPISWYGKAARVAGWSMALSGLVYAGLWAFAPFSVAVVGGCFAVLAGIAVTVWYCLSLRHRAKTAV